MKVPSSGHSAGSKLGQHPRPQVRGVSVVLRLPLSATEATLALRQASAYAVLGQGSRRVSTRLVMTAAGPARPGPSPPRPRFLVALGSCVAFLTDARGSPP